MAVVLQLFEEHHLVREDVGRITVVVVEVAQFRIKEARRSGRRDHPRGTDIGDVLPAAVHPALTLLDSERLLRALGHVVDHRVPDGARVLRHMHINVTELRQRVETQRSRVVHVEHRRRAV